MSVMSGLASAQTPLVTNSVAFTHPVTRRITPFKAIILQQEQKAFGWFLSTNQSGGLSITGE